MRLLTAIVAAALVATIYLTAGWLLLDTLCCGEGWYP